MRLTPSLALIAMALLGANGAQADVISVAPKDSAGLIEAIEFANHNSGDHIIELSAGSLYTLGSSAGDGRALGLPVIRGKIRILGNKAEIRRYSNEPMLLINVAATGVLRMENLTLAEGSRGALENHGTVELLRVKIRDNTAHGDRAIVANYGQLTAVDSDISDNEIAGAQRNAGIVLNLGEMRLTDTSLSNNTVSRRFGSLVSASAVLNLGSARLDRVKVTGNEGEDNYPDALASSLVNGRNAHFSTTDLVLSDNQPESANRVMDASISSN